jgi:hypothetical protein
MQEHASVIYLAVIQCGGNYHDVEVRVFVATATASDARITQRLRKIRPNYIQYTHL